MIKNMSLTPKTEQWIAFGFSVLVGVLNIFCWWLKRKCGDNTFKVVKNV